MKWNEIPGVGTFALMNYKNNYDKNVPILFNVVKIQDQYYWHYKHDSILFKISIMPRTSGKPIVKRIIQ